MWTWLQCLWALNRFKYSLNRQVAEEKALTDLDEQKTEEHFSQAINRSVQKYSLRSNVFLALTIQRNKLKNGLQT